ncbi:MAG TPA: DUF6443 domain-containing protein, partial [Fluviicoccus sp.]|nr:DUF6443 domain-containing protein [Fluviicoccus sp.]
GGGTSDLTRTTAYTYDSNGQIQTEVVEPDNAALSVTTTYGRDRFGNATSKTVTGGDIASRTESATYDASGRFVTSQTNALGHVAAPIVTDNRFGTPTSVKDPNAVYKVRQLDDFGRVTRELSRQTNADNSVTDGPAVDLAWLACDATCVTAQGEAYMVRATPTGSAATTTYYDRLGRERRKLTKGMDNSDVIVATEYDAYGRVSRVSKPYFAASGTIQWTTYTYDTLGRPLTETKPGNRVTTYAYNGLTTTLTNPKSQVSKQVRDALGRIASQVDAANQTQTFSYDAFGNVLTSTDVKGNVISNQYDLLGRKTQQTDPDLGAWTYTYNVLGQMKTQTDAKGQVTTWTYDLLGRPLTRAEPDLNSAWTWDTASKGIGKLAKLTGDNGFERTYAYDNLGRAIQASTKKTIDPNAQAADPDFVQGTGFDAAGRPDTVTYPTGFGYRNVYDANGYLTEVRNKDDGTLYWRAVTRDAEGRVTRTKLGNDLVTDRAYKADTGYLDTVKTGTLSGTTLTAGVQNDAYSFDAVGNLTLRSQYAGSTTMTETLGYDVLNRLTTVTPLNGLVRTSSYDEIGNILNRSDVGAYSYSGCGGAHRVCSILGAVNTGFTYDANGNMLTGNGRSLTWGATNYPTQIVQGTTTETFLYSPERERLRRTSVENGQTTTTVYLNPRMDLGGTFEKTVKPGSVVEYVHHVYAGGEAVGSVVTTAPVSAATLWSTDLSTAPTTANPNPSGLTMPTATADPNALITWDNTTADSRLLFATKTTATASNPYIQRQTQYLDDNVVFRGEFTPSMLVSGTNGRYFMFRVWNGGTTAAASKTSRWHSLYLRGAKTYANTVDGTKTDANGNLVSVNKDLNYPVTDGVTYVVEMETTTTSSILYVYPKGQTRAQGVRDVVFTDWKSPLGTQKRRLIMYSYSGPSEGSYFTWVDNLSETRFTATEPRYFHGDHQGNLMSVTDTTGTVTERLSYDAWGKRRNPDGSDDAVTTAWTSDLSIQPTTATTNSAKLTMPGTANNIATPTTQNGDGSIIAWDSTGQR